MVLPSFPLSWGTIAPLPPPLGQIRSVRQPEFSVTSPIMPATLSSPAPSFVWILSRPITPYIRDVMLKRSSITTAFDHITGCALKKVTKPLERRGLSLQMESRRCHSGFVGASSLRKWDPAPLTPCLPPYPPAWPDSKLQTHNRFNLFVCVLLLHATCEWHQGRRHLSWFCIQGEGRCGGCHYHWRSFTSIWVELQNWVLHWTQEGQCVMRQATMVVQIY